METTGLGSQMGPSGSNSEQKQAAAMALMQLQAVVEAQKVSMKILDKCFTKCVDSPGSDLSKGQKQCIWNCTQRLFDTESFIKKRLTGMAQKS